MQEANPGSVAAYAGSTDNLSILLEIQKAFEAGNDINIADLVGGQSGRIQSLESTFVSVTFEEEAASFWKKSPKIKVTSTVLEHARINEVGGLVFYAEGGDVDREDDDLDRKYTVVKFAGVKGAVTFAAKTTKMIEEAEVTETRLKTMAMVRGLDLKLWKGDSSINPLEFDGVFKQVLDNVKNPSQNIIDLRGKRLSDEAVNNGCLVIKSNYGHKPLKLWASLDAVNGYVLDKIANKVYYTNSAGDLNPSGQEFKKFSVAHGNGVVEEDIFMRAENALLNRILTSTFDAFKKNSTKAPDAPTVALTSEATATVYSLDNATYKYAITPINQYGEGLAVTASVTHSGGGKHTKLVISAAGTGEAALGYNIYRMAGSETDLRKYELVKTVKKTGADTTVYDDNEWIPGTTMAALIDWDPQQTYSVAQLADMMKLPYGFRSDKKEWLQKVYLVPRVFNPNKIVLFKNVGSLPNS